MRKTQFRILDALGRYIGNSISINRLTREVRAIYGTAHYANIHSETAEMQREGLIKMDKVGSTQLVSLDWESRLLTDILAQAELDRKHRFLKERLAVQLAVYDIGRHIHKLDSTRSVMLVSPEENIKLNRLELFFILSSDADKNAIREMAGSIQSNIRIDTLCLEFAEFARLAGSIEANPVREAISDMIVLFGPQKFWADAAGLAGRINVSEQLHPAYITEEDHVYNLERFGYAEFGTRLRRGSMIRIEYIIIGILFGDDVRRLKAISVILAKSRDTNYDLLVFLAVKYKVHEQLSQIMRLLDEIRPSKEQRDAISELERLGRPEKEPIKIRQQEIREVMRVYDA